MKKLDVMARQPPTPPGHHELQYDLHHIVQHNNSFPYSAGSDESFLYPEQNATNFEQAARGQPRHQPNSYADHRYAPSPHSQFSQSPAVGISTGSMHDHDDTHDAYASGSSYPDPYGYNGPLQGPPTPNSDSGIRTRSGRTAQQQTISPKPARARPARTRKRKPGKEKADVPQLTAPLSELTKDFVKTPIRDMGAWVNRSAEVRAEEVAKRNGYVARPMNSFMLYRSAYAERTKLWCSQNNHQVVSSVSGTSWPMEPPEIRDMYNDFAKTERLNHQKAHPNYKFQPSKAGGAGGSRKRKNSMSCSGDDGDMLDDASDFDDPEWTGGGVRRRKRTARDRRQNRDASLAVQSPLTQNLHDQSYANGINRSSWAATNEGRPVPHALNPNGLHYQYYQTTVHPSAPGVEDLHVRPMDVPISYSPDGYHQAQLPQRHSQALLGLPGAPHHDLLRTRSQTGTPSPHDHQVDPMLLAFDTGRSSVPQPQLRYDPASSMFLPAEQINQGMFMPMDSLQHQLAEYRPETWQVDPSMGRMEQPSEFESLMDDQTGSH